MTLARHVDLGYELGTGAKVQIPIRHMAVTGQTQEAGKTTTLEALIARSELRALTFITKRGEGAFAEQRVIDPYFREQADWRFVSSLLEAFLGERMKFERSWIMRATKGARTLAAVRRQVRQLQEKARGLSADVYMVLGEYLDELVPTIAAVRWAKRVGLGAGVNVMDLAAVPSTMQHLVIKSSIDWLLEHGTETVVVVPEAWKFIPQGRGTPVKLSAMAYIRQGAALGNYLWLDSQDIGGVDKELLRSVPVWILGVQREANEIKRTLANIPDSVAKPKASDIATLEVGQFIACWGKYAIRTYVQPAWLSAHDAVNVARGEIAAVPPPPRRLPARSEQSVSVDAMTEFVARGQRAQAAVDAAIAEATEGSKEMNAAQEKKLDDLIGTVARLATALERRPPLAASASVQNGPPPPAMPKAREQTTVGGLDGEQLYQSLKSRLIAEATQDPQILEVLVRRPEIRVRVERAVITVDGDALQGRLARLLLDGFFDDSKTSAHAHAELQRRGFATALPNVSRELAELARLGFLTRDNKWWRVVESMKRDVVEEQGHDARNDA